MTNETGDVVLRLLALENLLNELKARITALEQRLATAEQSQAGRWFQ